MKTLMIYMSIHHGNTEKIGKAMADVLKAKLVKPQDVDINTIAEYDLIGFGSGIYWQKHHKSLLNFVGNLPNLKNKKAFIFSTSGMKPSGFFNRFDRALEWKLREKGFDIIGGFSCLGFDTYGPFKLAGGISKGRPNEKDLKKARNFAKDLPRKLKEVEK